MVEVGATCAGTSALDVGGGVGVVVVVGAAAVATAGGTLVLDLWPR